MNKSDIKAFVLDLFFPNHCPLCGNVIKWDITYCQKCFDNLPWTGEELCNGCGNTKIDCTCDISDFVFVRAYAAVYYRDIGKSAVIFLKQTKNMLFPRIAAEKIYEDIRNDYYPFKADLIVPIPMSKHKYNSRGYNQAALIGQAISDLMDIPMREDVLKRHNSFIAQHKLSAKLRRKNAGIRYYHGNTDGIKDKNILLCDDVMTTGSTLNECAKLLLSAGAASVAVAVAATTIRENSIF